MSFLPLGMTVTNERGHALVTFQEHGQSVSPSRTQSEQYLRNPLGITTSDFATGLEVVWDLAFLPDGRLLVSERPGRVSVVSADGSLQPEPWAQPEAVFTGWSSGVLGLAVYPGYADEPWVYLMYTHEPGTGPINRIVRYWDDGARGTSMEVVVDSLPGGLVHNGGRIAFGPDGMLYVSVGDMGAIERAQDPTDPRGNLLRFTPDGGVPPDNPLPGSPTWAYGFRNVYGLDFHPRTGALLAADLGGLGHDQLHVVPAGGNHGWPEVVGLAEVEGYVAPIHEWLPAAPPGDLAFYDAGLMPEFQGDLFMTTLRSEALIRIRFQEPRDPHRPTYLERWFVSEDLGAYLVGDLTAEASEFGRLRAITVGPDGAMYVGTSNRDQGGGIVRPGDDRIVRIAKGGAAKN